MRVPVWARMHMRACVRACMRVRVHACMQRLQLVGTSEIICVCRVDVAGYLMDCVVRNAIWHEVGYESGPFM